MKTESSVLAGIRTRPVSISVKNSAQRNSLRGRFLAWRTMWQGWPEEDSRASATCMSARRAVALTVSTSTSTFSGERREFALFRLQQPYGYFP
jgi:hypothetical protein